MAKKDLSKLTAEELRIELAKEQERSDALQRDKEARDRADEERRATERREEERRRADAAAHAAGSEPTEEMWVKLEGEYGMTRDEIRSSWKLIQRATAPLQAELGTYRTRDAANDAVRLAKESIRAEDPQFPKYERFVDEYLADVPLSEKADSDKLKKHLDRAVNYAQGKARKTDKSFREEVETTREAGSPEQRADAENGFGEFAVSGMPLTIVNEKLVPDDFRKRHAHPEQKEGVRMNMRAQWNDQAPKKPR